MAIETQNRARMRALRLVVFDFDGVFTDNRVVVGEDGSEAVFCCRSDSLGLHRLRDVGVDMFILSTETNPVVAARAAKLDLPCLQGVDDKEAVLRTEIESRGIDLSDTAFVGNDINDANCLRIVGFPVVVSDAWLEVKSLAALVLSNRGGHGAVREFCDLVWLAKHGKTAEHG